MMMTQRYSFSIHKYDGCYFLCLSNMEHRSVTSTDLDPRIALHYGIPSTASVLAFDPIQRILAVGTLDGRIKIIGGDNIEGLLMSPKQLSYKHLEFLDNQGFLVGVSNDNDIQVWDLEQRCIACCFPWGSNITAFSVIYGTQFMYVGDEHGLMSVLKYDAEEGKLLQLPYHIPANSIAEAAGISLPNHQSIVGILPQPCTSGNRVLIAYENGLIILWDVSEGRVVLVRGYKDLQLKESSSGVSNEPPDDASNNEEEEKEISSLCWASSNGSILAVGYVDGDIMLWNTSNTSTKGPQPGASPNNVFKLQLSSAKRRIPVIVLHWSANRSQGHHGGQLFIYGGDEIGSEEVLTVLNLDWSSGIETLKCVNRVDLSLNGSFADMILIPHAGATENNYTAALFILTNPGQLHVYDDSFLSALASQQEKTPSIPSVQFPSVIPTIDPYMTLAKLSFLAGGTNSSKMFSAMKTGVKSTLTSCNKWALTGGVPSHLSFSEVNGAVKIYIAGYQDGSVRVWDATYPVLSLILVLDGEVQGIKVAGAGASVSALDFCSLSSTLAVGNECGLVRVYKLNTSSTETGFHFVTETKHEVHTMHQEKGLQSTAVFSFIDSSVQTLKFAKSGAELAVGFECGRVAVFDMSSISLKFLTNCVSDSSSAVISVTMKAFSDIQSLILNSPKKSGPENPNDPTEDVVLVLTRNAHILVIDGASGNLISSLPLRVKESTAISMYVIEGSNSVSEASHEKHPQHQSHEITVQNDSAPSNTSSGIKPEEVELQTSSEITSSGEKLLDSIVVLCCEDTVRLYSLKSVIQGKKKSIRKVNLGKPCCWATTFKKDEKVKGLILFYQTGAIEIRSLPDLEVVGENSLMSILRWSFKTNMDKMMSSYDNGQIALANGYELAFISFLAFENSFRIPESLPCLHDKVLAAAADAAIKFSSSQSSKQFTAPGLLGGIVKGFKGGKLGHAENLTKSMPKSQITMDLENIFSRVPFSDPSIDITDDQEVVELDIDDIEIDEPERVASTSSHQGKNDNKDKETDRQKLFEGGTADQTPRVRTPEEIIAKYRHGGDVAAVAAQARDRLAQRQEKLEKLSMRTEELQNGAENFAAMANELVKTMEGRKWWKI
ncbi:uncharacterized protein LOC122088875 isoform X2 [Macadamia integrifolia]|uniref:uncharacterized protein LOC122088875 isoform X2 n=1 Tax=Macadamia integrifolia TaxID=60698 RepID=UPI001C4FD643|nr:uncharacterized protein LOC122088875 isoform X2 [Macadamia integrifolia]